MKGGTNAYYYYRSAITPQLYHTIKKEHQKLEQALRKTTHDSQTKLTQGCVSKAE